MPIAIFKTALSIFVGVSLALDVTFAESVAVSDSSLGRFSNPVTPVTLVVFIAAFACAFLLLSLLQKGISILCSHNEGGSARPNPLQKIDDIQAKSFSSYVKARWTFLLASFITIFLGWFIVFLNYYPGTSMNDQLWIIDGPIGASNNHPIMYNLALAGCVRIGTHLFNDGNVGFALFVIFQMAICASLVSIYAIWLAYRKTPKAIVLIVVIFFAFFPIISNFSICAVKDTLFSYFLLGWIPFLFEALRSPHEFWGKKSSYALLALLILSVSLLRNNGIYITAVLAILLVIAFRKINAKKIAVTSGIALILSLAPSFGLSLLGHEQLFRESVGIPLQQISAVVCEDEESLTPEQKSYINQIIPIEIIENSYSPQFVDLIKYNDAFDTAFLQSTKQEFIAAYIQIGLQHPEIYTRAFLAQTWGYWSLTAWDSTQSYFFGISDNISSPTYDRLMERWGLHNESLYPTAVSQVFDNIYRALVPLFPGPGFCFVLVLIGTFAVCVATKTAKWAMLAAPCILLWLTILISTPLACSMRYAFPIFVSIPIIWAVAFACVFPAHTRAYSEQQRVL